MAETRVKSEGALDEARRPVRADARRNEDALLEAAKHVFATSGVDAPIREIAARANVGLATLYRRFPKRSDLIAGVFRREIDMCADDAAALAAQLPPGAALDAWLMRYTQFIATKRGLGAALRSGDPAFDELPIRFRTKFEPALQALLDAAADAGAIRPHVIAYDLLRSIGNLAVATGQDSMEHISRVVGLLTDGLKYGAPTPEAGGAG